jgi:hypothetical protein
MCFVFNGFFSTFLPEPAVLDSLPCDEADLLKSRRQMKQARVESCAKKSKSYLEM